jgi:hypothetical protein
VAELVALPTGGTSGKTLTVLAAADAFLGSLGKPNTVRSYRIGIGKTAMRLGEARPLASVADEEIGEALEVLWGGAAVNTWNARRAAAAPAQGPHRGPGVPHPPSPGAGQGAVSARCLPQHRVRALLDALTHLGENGVSLLMLMAKSRHKKAENVRRYFHPGPGSTRG